MNNKIKNNIHYISTGLLALISFFGLAFPLAKGSLWGSENGFNMISFASNIVQDSYSALLYIMGVFCILQLLASIAAFGYFMFTIYSKEKKNEKQLAFIFNIIYLCFLFIYMILGIIFAALSSHDLGTAFYTLSYLPFILGAFVFIFYYIQQKLSGEYIEKVEKPVKVKKAKKAKKGEIVEEEFEEENTESEQ